MDTISITDLEVMYRVGVPDEERAQSQRLLISVELGHDFTDATATDDLRTTIDYYALSRWLGDFGEGKTWKLIERLAVDLAQGIRKKFHAQLVTVEVKKFILADARHVSVKVTRPQRRPRGTKSSSEGHSGHRS